MFELELWKYELDFLDMTAIGTTTAEIKSLYPWLREKGFTTPDFAKYPFYNIDELCIRHYLPKQDGRNRVREITLYNNVQFRFNPASFIDFVRQVSSFESRRFGDLYLFETQLPEMRKWLWPDTILRPLSKKPWKEYAQLIESDNAQHQRKSNPRNTCYVENGMQLRVH